MGKKTPSVLVPLSKGPFESPKLDGGKEERGRVRLGAHSTLLLYSIYPMGGVKPHQF